MNKLILSSNLTEAKDPTPVIGATMQRFCNCNELTEKKDG